MPNVLYAQPGGESVFPTTGFGRPGSFNPAEGLLGDMQQQRKKSRKSAGGSPLDALGGGEEGGVNVGDILKILAMAGMFL